MSEAIIAPSITHTPLFKIQLTYCQGFELLDILAIVAPIYHTHTPFQNTIDALYFKRGFDLLIFLAIIAPIYHTHTPLSKIQLTYCIF